MGNYYEDLTLFGLVKALFVAAAATSFLWAVHHVARGTMLTARVAAFDELEDAYTPEERELLIHKIKHDSLRA